MFSLPMAKLAAQIVAGLGVSKIVSDIVRNNVVITSTAQTVTVWAGNLVISSLVVEQSSNFIERVTSEMTTYIESRKADAAN